jgi:Ca2+-binding RTX toxin-like protein
MAWIIPLENTGEYYMLTTTDNLYIGRNIYHAGRAYGTGSNQRIVIDGTAAGAGGNVYSLGSSGSVGNLIQIGKTGSVTGLGVTGIPVAAIYMTGDSGKVINQGEIIASLDSGAGVGINSEDVDSVFTVANSGTIEAGSIGVASVGPAGSITLTNTGTIIGGEGETPITEDAALPNGAYVSVTTSGTAVVSSAVVDSIYNSGRMVGAILLGGGADYYEGRNGTVEGDVLGGGGQDRLFSGVGNDRLFGEDGNDQLMGGPGGDLLDGGAGTDTVLYVSATAGVSANLGNAATNTGDAAGDSYVSIENLTGSSFNDVLVGNGAANILSGGNGNDTLRGAAGNDILAGGAGNDIFVFAAPLNAATNVDRINDFSVADDTMQLENLYFATLTTTGVLAPAAFQSNGTGLATTASDRIIYETDTGNLFYDADGVGGVAGILFARLSPDLVLTSADFVVI